MWPRIIPPRLRRCAGWSPSTGGYENPSSVRHERSRVVRNIRHLNLVLAQLRRGPGVSQVHLISTQRCVGAAVPNRVSRSPRPSPQDRRERKHRPLLPGVDGFTDKLTRRVQRSLLFGEPEGYLWVCVRPREVVDMVGARQRFQSIIVTTGCDQCGIYIGSSAGIVIVLSMIGEASRSP